MKYRATKDCSGATIGKVYEYNATNGTLSGTGCSCSSTWEPQNDGGNMDSFKKYLEKNRDMFFTIGIVLLLDHFVFGGAFREKLKGIIDGFLDNKTKAIENA